MVKILPNETDIYGITDSRLNLGRPVELIAKQLLENGVKIIQYREKKLSKKKMLEECLAIKKLTLEYGACFIVNDHIDLAIISRADGVHIGQDDLPPKEVRKLVGPHKIIGLSTHSPEQALHSLKQPIDYIGVGPIFSTQTKEDVVAPVGFDYLEWVSENIKLPFVAIGGIKAGNILEVIKHGAKCCAMVSELTMAPDIPKKIEELRSIIKEKINYSN